MPADAGACELCTPHDVLIETPLAYVRHDSNSLSRGHVLVVPRSCGEFLRYDARRTIGGHGIAQ
jgi:diadenosine tetraphosphate (Ap4A) HIT family hydrolase